MAAPPALAIFWPLPYSSFLTPPIEAAVELLRQGEVIGLPTETVYGLAADGTNPVAVRRIFEIKGRPTGHPLILHLGSAEWLPRYAARIPDAALLLARLYWPGPLTLVLPRTRAVPDEVTGGLDTVALRVPNHPIALEVLAQLDRPLAAPSANRFGRVSPTTRAHVLSDLGPDVPLVLDGGPSSVGVESTIVDLSGRMPRLLRHGGISLGDLEQVLGTPLEELTIIQPAEIRAPGMLESHYAPEAPLELYAQHDFFSRLHEQRAAFTQRPRQRLGALLCGTKHEEVAKLGPTECVSPPPELHVEVFRYYREEERVPWLDLIIVPGGPPELAQSVYGALRYLDSLGVDVIVASSPSADGLGRAVQDRLARAAAPRPDASFRA